MDENRLNEADLVVVPVVYAENLVFDSEIQVMDDVIVDPGNNGRLLGIQIQEFKREEGCEMVKVRDKRAAGYRTLYTE
ncbi:hypothetical protein Tco_0488868 [Tanacetum coccineum]